MPKSVEELLREAGRKVTVIDLDHGPFPQGGTKWELLHPRVTMDHLGYIPGFLNESDPRPAKAQIDDNYKFGGWQKFDGFRLSDNNVLCYPGDPPLKPLAQTRLHDKETILVYESAWVAIVQPDRSFEVARLD